MTGRLFTDDGAAARDDALARVEANADPEWMVAALNAVAVAAVTHDTFTTDDVDLWAVTHEPRALGAVMRRAQRDGLCVATDEWRLSTDPRCHRRPKRVWRSLLAEVSR